jgi:hypothetical protein
MCVDMMEDRTVDTVDCLDGIVRIVEEDDHR